MDGLDGCGFDLRWPGCVQIVATEGVAAEGIAGEGMAGAVEGVARFAEAGSVGCEQI